MGQQNFKTIKKEEINKKIQNWDNEEWKRELASKKSVEMYERCKNNIKEESFYDNVPASVTFFPCRSNTLKLNDRNRFVGKEIKCIGCEEETENIEHFLLECKLYQDLRNKSKLFNRPYQEKWIEELLFGPKTNKEEMERIIHEFWKVREKERKKSIQD